ncbi:MAG: alpha/beta hydrolase fold domain-containing protein [Kiritimatiellales bacterium]|nr:alpha/beta hydrolase fold domain-containing protein [Kiritimatiellales bacterium]
MKSVSTTGVGIFLFLSILTAQGAPQGGYTFDSLLERQDKDKDGALAKSEFKGPQQLFSRMDTDQDGILTRAEFEAGRKSRQGGRSGQKQQPSSRSVPEDVTLHRDLEYAVADGESLKLDLYLPKAPDRKPPLMVWIHGGGWKNGDKAQVNRAILRLSEAGYAVASINYRLEDLYIHPKQIHDCKGAIRWLRTHAEKYGYDPARIAVGGGSAGGHLALLLGLSSGVEDLEGSVGGNTDKAGSVRAIVDLYGPSELKVFSENSARFNAAHKFNPEQLLHASPLTYLTPDDPPVLILQGDKDNTVPLEQSQLVDKRYKAAGLVSELHVIPGAGHGGAVFSDEERYQLIKAFLDKHL